MLETELELLCNMENKIIIRLQAEDIFYFLQQMIFNS